MIDPRFPPHPKRVKVPLYPLSGNLWNCLKPAFSASYSYANILKWLADHYGLSSSQIHVSGKASYSLFLFLQWLQRNFVQPLKVALPAFCCPDVCQAILAAQGVPVFMDMKQDLTLSLHSIHYIQRLGCQVLLWPHLFGERPWSSQVLATIKQARILLIEDEAQSFPHQQRRQTAADVSLFSFGASKKLAALGGGGLAIHDASMAQRFLKAAPNCYSDHSYHFDQIKKNLQQQATHWHRPLAQLCKIASHLEASLKHLLEKKAFNGGFEKPVVFNRTQLSIVKQRLESYKEEEHLSRTEHLKKIVENLFGMQACDWIKSVQSPSIFPLRVPADQRHCISSLLSKRGIQTTWYYFPLNQLSSLQSFESEETPITNTLSSEILILPFQWRHTNHHFKLLTQALEECAYESRTVI